MRPWVSSWAQDGDSLLIDPSGLASVHTQHPGHTQVPWARGGKPVARVPCQLLVITNSSKRFAITMARVCHHERPGQHLFLCGREPVWTAPSCSSVPSCLPCPRAFVPVSLCWEPGLLSCSPMLPGLLA